ncbi:hypothetical protein RUM44_005995 [Polyplax serrata]|uniref:Uncharacterized protein n=1 Tax=Polyplax serrata TaxID=468196 RepID=A0ABR1AYN9_POLSC
MSKSYAQVQSKENTGKGTKEERLRMVNNREWDSQDEIGKKKKKTCEMYCSSTRDCLDGVVLRHVLRRDLTRGWVVWSQPIHLGTPRCPPSSQGCCIGSVLSPSVEIE